MTNWLVYSLFRSFVSFGKMFIGSVPSVSLWSVFPPSQKGLIVVITNLGLSAGSIVFSTSAQFMINPDGGSPTEVDPTNKDIKYFSKILLITFHRLY